jgi:hypothetical protein
VAAAGRALTSPLRVLLTLAWVIALAPAARLLFRDRIMPLAVRRCRDISVEGFEIDRPRPLMSKGEVVAADAGGITLRIGAAARTGDDGSPMPARRPGRTRSVATTTKELTSATTGVPLPAGSFNNQSFT